MKFNINKLAWDKMHNLLPVVVQDARSGVVLMLGYMNQEALEKTLAEKLVTFYSRSKQRLWTKGEESGNQLKLVSLTMDCDQDTLLALVNPTGPVCHLGTESCFDSEDMEKPFGDWQFLLNLEKLLISREKLRPEKSYTTSLFKAGMARMAQKVGEEGVEVALAAVVKNDEELCSEIADLLFHVLVLLCARKLTLSEVLRVLKLRRAEK